MTSTKHFLVRKDYSVVEFRGKGHVDFAAELNASIYHYKKTGGGYGTILRDIAKLRAKGILGGPSLHHLGLVEEFVKDRMAEREAAV